MLLKRKIDLYWISIQKKILWIEKASHVWEFPLVTHRVVLLRTVSVQLVLCHSSGSGKEMTSAQFTSKASFLKLENTRFLLGSVSEFSCVHHQRAKTSSQETSEQLCNWKQQNPPSEAQCRLGENG